MKMLVFGLVFMDKALIFLREFAKDKEKTKNRVQGTKE